MILLMVLDWLRTILHWGNKRRIKMKKLNQTKPTKDNKVVIGDEWTGNDKVEYSCNYCNCVLVKLRDISGKNSSLWCRTCSIEYPDENEVRKKSKLETPNKTIEPAVSTTPGIPDISLHKEPELRGGFAELAKKGSIRFTSYSTAEKDYKEE